MVKARKKEGNTYGFYIDGLKPNGKKTEIFEFSVLDENQKRNEWVDFLSDDRPQTELHKEFGLPKINIHDSFSCENKYGFLEERVPEDTFVSADCISNQRGGFINWHTWLASANDPNSFYEKSRHFLKWQRSWIDTKTIYNNVTSDDDKKQITNLFKDVLKISNKKYITLDERTLIKGNFKGSRFPAVIYKINIQGKQVVIFGDYQSFHSLNRNFIRLEKAGIIEWKESGYNDGGYDWTVTGISSEKQLGPKKKQYTIKIVVVGKLFNNIKTWFKIVTVLVGLK